MSKNMYRLPFLLAAAAIVMAVAPMALAKDSWDDKARGDKADYLFLEAQSAYAAKEFDRYVKLIDRAYALDSADVDIAGEWGMLAVINENADSAEFEHGYRNLMRRFNADPGNYISGAILANVARQCGRYEDAMHIWQTLDSIYPKKTQVPMELAKAYLYAYTAGDSAAFDKAIAIYDRIAEGEGDNVETVSPKISAYYLKNDTAAAVRLLDALDAAAPGDSYTSLYIGANFDYLNMPERALEFYDKACRLDSANGAAFMQRARFYSERGDSAAFDREVFHALVSPSLDLGSKLEILRSYVSTLYTDRSQEPRIRQLFATLEQQHTGEPEIHNLYGSYLYELDDYAGAAEELSYSTALDPANESSWNMLVHMTALANDTVNALALAREALKRFPENLYFPLVAANMLHLQGHTGEAIAVLDSVDVDQSRNHEGVSTLLSNKGDLYAACGDTLRAIATYDEAISHNPDNKMAMNNAAYFIAITGGDLDKAERYSSRSLQGDELNPTYLDTYAWIQFLKKDYSLAKKYIDIALNAYTVTEPDSVAGDHASMPVEDVGDDEADYWEEDDAVSEIFSEPSAEIYDHAGDIYFMNGEPEAALAFWRKAAELDPGNALIEKKVTNETIFLK